MRLRANGTVCSHGLHACMRACMRACMLPVQLLPGRAMHVFTHLVLPGELAAESPAQAQARAARHDRLGAVHARRPLIAKREHAVLAARAHADEPVGVHEFRRAVGRVHGVRAAVHPLVVAGVPQHVARGRSRVDVDAGRVCADAVRKKERQTQRGRKRARESACAREEETETETSRQAGRQAGRQTDRQTDRWAEMRTHTRIHTTHEGARRHGRAVADSACVPLPIRSLPKIVIVVPPAREPNLGCRAGGTRIAGLAHRRRQRWRGLRLRRAAARALHSLQRPHALRPARSKLKLGSFFSHAHTAMLLTAVTTTATMRSYQATGHRTPRHLQPSHSSVWFRDAAATRRGLCVCGRAAKVNSVVTSNLPKWTE